MPFDQLSHNASVSAISNNAKRSFRTSTSSSFYCIGNESLGDVLSNNNNNSESSSSPSQSSGSTAGPKSLHAGSPPSFSNPFHTRRLSAASRFLAAAAPVLPPVPPLSLDTVLGRRVVTGATATTAAPVLKEDDASSSSSPSLRHETATTPSQQFPFQTASSSSTADSKLFNGPGGVLVGGSLPSKTRAASVSKRSHDPAIPFGWDGPPPSEPVSPPQSPNDTTAFPSNTGKQRKSSSSSSRRPKTTSSLASSIVSMTNKSLSKFHRPTSAGSSMITSSSITAATIDEPVPAVPRLPGGKGLMTLGLRRGSAYDSSSVSRRSSHPKLFATTTPLSPPPPLPQPIVSQMQTIKHDHELLQTLFYGVFERRFINTCPTAILPSMLNIYFQNVLVTPPIDFPTPPPPAMAREMCRREKRNMTQREQGRGGLEYSQGVGLHVAQSLNNIKAAAAVVSPQIARLKGTMGAGMMGGRFHLGSSSPSSWNSGEVESHRLVKRARSSPALRVSSSQGFTGAGAGGGSGN
ncbi:hypothetical protein FRC17_007368, partial [Serendipita sp. 399]